MLGRNKDLYTGQPGGKNSKDISMNQVSVDYMRSYFPYDPEYPECNKDVIMPVYSDNGNVNSLFDEFVSIGLHGIITCYEQYQMNIKIFLEIGQEGQEMVFRSGYSFNFNDMRYSFFQLDLNLSFSTKEKDSISEQLW
jgi:hypothetical protein